MDCVEKEIYEYICDLNCTMSYCIDLRFTCFGDTKKFYGSSGYFETPCVEYLIDGDVEKIKTFFTIYLDSLWTQKTERHNRIALLVDDVSKQSSGYKVSVGSALFDDPSINGGD